MTQTHQEDRTNQTHQERMNQFSHIQDQVNNPQKNSHCQNNHLDKVCKLLASRIIRNRRLTTKLHLCNKKDSLSKQVLIIKSPQY